ncbi:hypothetical protein CPC08DRAFT_651264 [Agrocybe pediades]|nr:hypothetical protein CPC08DRAFT_651264 [Agrocybe pediades]
MRQHSQTPEDAKLRKALENMKYATCTPDDITFLRTLQVGPGLDRPKLTDPRFHDMSIITGLNSQKDHINYLGCRRFAEESGQELINFYSVDKSDGNHEHKPEKCKQGRKPKVKGRRLTDYDKDALWSAPPSSSKHIPGKLSLCVGLPVIIRHNCATELCMTKGQEGLVAGWDSYDGPDGKKCLETLYVKLLCPPQDIHIPGLDKNIVPVPKMGTAISCDMPDDSTM